MNQDFYDFFKEQPASGYATERQVMQQLLHEAVNPQAAAGSDMGQVGEGSGGGGGAVPGGGMGVMGINEEFGVYGTNPHVEASQILQALSGAGMGSRDVG
jgi:hypothetical protein